MRPATPPVGALLGVELEAGASAPFRSLVHDVKASLRQIAILTDFVVDAEEGPAAVNGSPSAGIRARAEGLKAQTEGLALLAETYFAPLAVRRVALAALMEEIGRRLALAGGRLEPEPEPATPPPEAEADVDPIVLGAGLAALLTAAGGGVWRWRAAAGARGVRLQTTGPLADAFGREDPFAPWRRRDDAGVWITEFGPAACAAAAARNGMSVAIERLGPNGAITLTAPGAA